MASAMLLVYGHPVSHKLCVHPLCFPASDKPYSGGNTDSIFFFLLLISQNSNAQGECMDLLPHLHYPQFSAYLVAVLLK